MANDVFTRHVTPNITPQSEQAREDQVPNSAGGWAFTTPEAARLNRFLTLGTEGGTYYATERKLTKDNAAMVTAMAQAGNPLLIDETVAVSQAGRAPRNNPALFALAAAAGLGDTAYRQRAFDALPLVARTGTHFLTFTDYAQMFRGWGPQMVKGMRNWYLRFNATNDEVATWKERGDQGEPRPLTLDDLTYQVLKYKQRDGWSQRDVLRLCGLKEAGPRVDAAHEALFNYVMKGEFRADLLSPLVDIAEQAHETRNVRDWTRLIASNRGLSWEMLPSEALAEADVWTALIENGNLPLGALLRNLSRLTRLGVTAPMGFFNRVITGKLTDPETVLKARVHPIAVLIAMSAYGQGHGVKGKSTWTPVPQVMDALNEMFYLAFGNVEPSGKRTLIALDVSGSMSSPGWSAGHTSLHDSTGMTPRDLAAAMSMIVMRTEPQYAVTAFTNTLAPIDISAAQRLDDVIRAVGRMPAGGTDCSLPMQWAQQHGIGVDTFQVFTDNETWAGSMHPHEALRRYRAHTGINARLQVVGMTATDFTIADPADPGQLDVAGFDSAIPRLLADHARGDL